MNEKEALLNQLRDVEVPEVSQLPALGWWLLLLAMLLSGLLYWASIIRRRKNAWKRQALEELDLISASVAQDTNVETIARCSELARKVVLAVDQREYVAALHGREWLEKLDAICGRPEFSNGIGQLLLDQPYQKSAHVAASDIDALLASMNKLIQSAKGARS